MCRRRTSSAATESLRRRHEGDASSVGAITGDQPPVLPACDDAARREPDIGAAARLPFTTNNAHALGVGARELVVATQCAWLECCCDFNLIQWVTHINFPSTPSSGMFAAEFAPMETDSAMVKRQHGRFDGRPVREFCCNSSSAAREALLGPAAQHRTRAQVHSGARGAGRREPAALSRLCVRRFATAVSR